MREILAARPDDSTPLYLQLARNIRHHIANGGIDPGNALPSERDLIEMTGLSRVTIRKGIRQLIEEGILFRKQGSGTFVARRIETGSVLTGFSEDARSRGEDTGVIWMIKTYAQPTDEEASMLQITGSVSVARLGRIRLAGGEPLAIEHAVVAAEFLPNLDRIGDSLYAALEVGGHRPTRGHQWIRGALATPTEAGMLSIEQNAAVLRIERLAFLEGGRPIEFTRSTYRADRYVFVSDLEGGQSSSKL
ncbi:GntR family transcriptional regulator [Sphingomonas vulcanisoli]|uniref:GntR family transcriptional regulator n=1 Tax=Sphingomonas vulcanisoli TaxID=1658060 RepID=A0ABX0TMJ0_9SPHN|nr:GntR family transcriptional regulator [Sphingomonas vulcanisoli]NIJ06736.1 GntR family transcriptional regulator [Sphingomonas vulcanisoli]